MRIRLECKHPPGWPRPFGERQRVDAKMGADVEANGARTDPVTKIGEHARIVDLGEQHSPPRVDSESFASIDRLPHPPPEARPHQPRLIRRSDERDDPAVVAGPFRDRPSDATYQPHVFASSRSTSRATPRRRRRPYNAAANGRARQSHRPASGETTV